MQWWNSKTRHAQASGQWCVPKPSSCGRATAKIVSTLCVMKGWLAVSTKSGSCFYPNTTINHASVVMNMYYQSNLTHPVSCWFRKQCSDSPLRSKLW
ncbi:hypothetical protein HAX54_027223 [Datura stramonium]|uniref:X8 domain-containing protein n=1 Tax=Datura stramonium TaxID=4076 RepID=A0ABS8S8K6_DATST|nr:hypothetical protein [Datura stramonium]